MQIEDWPSAKSLSPLYRELKQLELHGRLRRVSIRQVAGATGQERQRRTAWRIPEPLDTGPAAGRVKLRKKVDYGVYDTEFAAAIAKRAKGTKIRFPDLYREKPN